MRPLENFRYGRASATEIKRFRLRTDDPRPTYFEFLSLHTDLRRLVQDAPITSQEVHGRDYAGPDASHVCIRCGTVAFFNITPTWLREHAGYDKERSTSQLTLVVKLNSIEEHESVVLDHCPVCSWGPLPMDNEADQRWLPLPFRDPDIVSALFQSFAASDRYVKWLQSRSLRYRRVSSVFAFMSGTKGAFEPQEVPPFYNPSRAKLWMRHCEQYHGSRCNEGGPGVKGMRLIDCVKMEIVKADSSWKWIALSYVWGAYDTDRSSWSRTVIDAIKVTKEIGYRYLWVDKHCIGQDEGLHKDEQIRGMHNIYQGADMTIVAASGRSMHDRIDGVNRERRATFSNEHIGDAVNYIHTSSPWWERAWTYQEGVLSRRLLVFSDLDMSFYCQETAWTESLGDMFHLEDQTIIQWHALKRDCSLFKENLRPRQHTIESTTNMEDGRQEKTILRDYCQQVAIYSKRKLTYDSDALKAFSGVMEDYQKQTAAVSIRTMLGLPIVLPRAKKHISAVSMFIALSWCGVTPDRRDSARRDLFPSWTWASREQSIEWPFLNLSDGWQAVSFMKHVVLVFEDGTHAPQSAEGVMDRLDSVKSIRFEVPVVPYRRISVHSVTGHPPRKVTFFGALKLRRTALARWSGIVFGASGVAIAFCVSKGGFLLASFNTWRWDIYFLIVSAAFALLFFLSLNSMDDISQTSGIRTPNFQFGEKLSGRHTRLLLGEYICPSKGKVKSFLVVRRTREGTVKRMRCLQVKHENHVDVDALESVGVELV